MRSYRSFRDTKYTLGLIAGGVALLILSGFFYLKTKRFISKSICTEGEIVSFYKDSLFDKKKLDTLKIFYSEILFHTKDGKEIKVRDDIVRRMGEEQKGKKLKIYYNPLNPSNFMIDRQSFLNQPFLMMVTGLVLVIGGIFRRYWEKNEPKGELLKEEEKK